MTYGLILTTLGQAMLVTPSFAATAQQKNCQVFNRTDVLKQIQIAEELVQELKYSGTASASLSGFFALGLGSEAYIVLTQIKPTRADHKALGAGLGAMAIIFAAQTAGTVINDIRIIQSAEQYIEALKNYAATSKDINFCQNSNETLAEKLERIRQLRSLTESQIKSLSVSLETAQNNKALLAQLSLVSVALIGFAKAESSLGRSTALAASALSAAVGAYSAVKLYFTANEISQMKADLLLSVKQLKAQESVLKVVIETQKIK